MKSFRLEPFVVRTPIVNICMYLGHNPWLLDFLLIRFFCANHPFDKPALLYSRTLHYFLFAPNRDDGALQLHIIWCLPMFHFSRRDSVALYIYHSMIQLQYQTDKRTNGPRVIVAYIRANEIRESCPDPAFFNVACSHLFPSVWLRAHN